MNLTLYVDDVRVLSALGHKSKDYAVLLSAIVHVATLVEAKQIATGKLTITITERRRKTRSDKGTTRRKEPSVDTTEV